MEPTSDDCTTASSHWGELRFGTHYETHLDEGQNGHDEFNSVTQGCVQETTERLAESHRRFLRREPKQPSCRQYCGSIEKSPNEPSGMMAIKLVMKHAVSEIDSFPPLCLARYSAHPAVSISQVTTRGALLTDRDEHKQDVSAISIDAEPSRTSCTEHAQASNDGLRRVRIQLTAKST